MREQLRGEYADPRGEWSGRRERRRGDRGAWGGWPEAGPGFGGPGGRGGRRGHRGGPPPWMAGLFGEEDRGRGPRVRRGDVRHAILDVLRTNTEAETGERLNGYQVIGEIAERSNGAWKPSPGSVYPTIQQLQDEGLVLAHEDAGGRKTLGLSEQGTAYAAEHADELAAVWAPFTERRAESRPGADLKPEIGQMMAAVWQIASAGSSEQRAAAVEVMAETRRRLYGILADGPAAPQDEDGEDGEES